MTSLSEAYGGPAGEEGGLRRLYLGVGLFLLGAILVVAAIVITTTDVLLQRGFTLTAAREFGGIIGGIGVPAVFLGVFSVLPAAKRTRAAAVIGASIAILGVALFAHAYPCQWSGSNCGQGLPDLTLLTVGVYFLGTITTFWCLFVGVANFKTRNDPGGTVKMEITRQGETRIVEVERSRLGGLGGIGFLGGTPDGEVETQTNAGAAGATVSDGGAAAEDIRSPLDADGPKPAGDRTDAGLPKGDTYCGNCAHFDYVRTDDGIRPYCGYYAETMDDMDPCDEWTRR
jgi:MFS family permease